MCIKEVPAVLAGGKLYATKKEAITAVFQTIGDKLLKSSPAQIVNDIMAEADELLELIPAHRAAWPEVEPEKGAEGTASQPEGTASQPEGPTNPVPAERILGL